MSKNLSPAEILAILENGNFHELVGVVEDECLEFKGEPYILKRDYPKLELAKDVSGLANTPNGGLILIGVRTERVDTHIGDEIVEVRPIPKNLIDRKQYHDILKQWIYPEVSGVEVKWFPSPDDAERGLAVIIIPRQTPTSQPFLLTRTMTDTGKRTELVFGYVERRRAHVQPRTVHELQMLLCDGLSYHEQMEKRFGDLELMLYRLVSLKKDEEEIANEEARKERLQARVGLALGESGLHTGPAFVLRACPLVATNIPSLFADDTNEVVRLLEHPPELRRSGLDLDTGSRARIVRGEKRQAVSSGYKVLELWPDGTLIFCATGEGDFLAWGRYYKDGAPLRINQLVLIESSYLFAKLAKEVYVHARPFPTRIEFGLELRRMSVAGKKCSLNPGPLTDFTFGFGSHEAPDSGNVFTVVWEGSTIPPELVSYQLVCRVYEWFGFSHSEIPYTAKLGDDMGIDPEQIRRIGER
jgi:hypothetical protein